MSYCDDPIKYCIKAVNQFPMIGMGSYWKQYSMLSKQDNLLKLYLIIKCIPDVLCDRFEANNDDPKYNLHDIPVTVTHSKSSNR